MSRFRQRSVTPTNVLREQAEKTVAEATLTLTGTTLIFHSDKFNAFAKETGDVGLTMTDDSVRRERVYLCQYIQERAAEYFADSTRCEEPDAAE